MCTVSWLHSADGYELFCNRDERVARLPALAPRVRTRHGLRFVVPADGDFGGSWIGVNECGVSLCLLNRYQGERAAESHTPKTSRGLLLIELMDSVALDEVARRIGAMNLARFQPFTFIALEPSRAALIAQWDGRKTVIADDDGAMPFTSSSFDQAGVSTVRLAYFRQLVAMSGIVDAALLRRFHASHFPTPGAHSVCLHRDGARTVSFSRIKVAGGTVEFDYYPHAPCMREDSDEYSSRRIVIGVRCERRAA